MFWVLNIAHIEVSLGNYGGRVRKISERVSGSKYNIYRWHYSGNDMSGKSVEWRLLDEETTHVVQIINMDSRTKQWQKRNGSLDIV